MVIREFRKSDLGRLKAITAICFEDVSIDHNIEKRHGQIAGKSWQWRKRRDIDGDADSNPAGIFVAVAGGRAIGYISTRVDSGARIGGIANIAVLPRYRGQGIAGQLMRRAFAHLRQRGMRYVRIETLEQNRAGMAFYPKLGFRPIARQVHFIMPLDRARPRQRAGAARR